MDTKIFLAATLLATGCASIADEDERRDALARQTFDATYTMAVSSWFEETDIPTVGFQLDGADPGDMNRAINKIDSVLKSSGSEWTYYNNTFNDATQPSAFERLLARELTTEIGVQPIYVDRADIKAGLPTEPSAALAVKKIARERGYDAFSILYFQPFVNVLSEDVLGSDALEYALTYTYTFVVRSVELDELIYYKKDSISCGLPSSQDYTLPSGATISRALENTAIPSAECESAIHSQIVDEFISHVAAPAG